MSVYSVKGKGWRYDFTLKGTRHTEAWFRTKTEAKQAEARRREELAKPKPDTEKIPTDMAFLELANRRLDHVKSYNSKKYYKDNVYSARRWIERWGHLRCSQITEDMVEDFILERGKGSAYVANKEIRYLLATFNFGIKKKLIKKNPVAAMEFLSEDKRMKYVPRQKDIDKMMGGADLHTKDYLWTIRETMGRVSEINRLTWDDVNFDGRYVVLYTRKKKGGHLTPRKVPMTQRLFEILSRRYSERDKSKPWVFWHTYWSSKTGEKKEGPYQDRKRIMKSLCKKADVRYFRFHALRHAGASIMEYNNVPIGSIQRILGHENRTTTEIYLHSVGQAERNAMSIYENASQNSHTELSHTKQEKGSHKG